MQKSTFLLAFFCLINHAHAENLDITLPDGSKLSAVGNAKGTWGTDAQGNIVSIAGSASGTGNVVTKDGQVLSGSGSAAGSGERDSQGNMAGRGSVQGSGQGLGHVVSGSANGNGAISAGGIASGSGAAAGTFDGKQGVISVSGIQYRVFPNGTVIQLNSLSSGASSNDLPLKTMLGGFLGALVASLL